MKILIVDDSKAMRMIIQRTLRVENAYEVMNVAASLFNEISQAGLT